MSATAWLGLNGLLSTGALVYVVRRVSPWPKPPAPPGQGTSRSGGKDKTPPGAEPGAAGSTT